MCLAKSNFTSTTYMGETTIIVTKTKTKTYQTTKDKKTKTKRQKQRRTKTRKTERTIKKPERSILLSSSPPSSSI